MMRLWWAGVTATLRRLRLLTCPRRKTEPGDAAPEIPDTPETMPGPVTFENRETLFDRLLAARREVVFMVGAPLTAPERGSTLGVHDVAGMIARIRNRLAGTPPRILKRFDESLAGAKTPYQAAFGFLAATLGQDDANAVIRGAVLEAFRADVRPAGVPDEDACAGLERQLDEWHYRPGVAALGQLAARFPERYGRTVLTTNFDPLLGLAVRRAGGRAYTSFFAGDGNLEQVRGEGTHVVHLHGYWYGTDTLHVPSQLGQDRPRLRASLSRFLQTRTVVVMAYGGWDDIFTRTLAEIAADAAASPDVLWCFYDGDQARLRGANEALFEQLRPTLGGRTILYAGIDCHEILPELVKELGAAPLASVSGDLPVMDDADLIGRASQRDQLLAAFGRGQAVQVIGPRRMGKSSLLRWMERKARELGRPAAFVNARGLAGRSPADLVKAAGEAIGKREVVKRELEALRAVPDASDAARAAERLGPVCLMVDEADALAEGGHGFDKGFFDTLRALGQAGVLQWVSGSQRDLFDLFLTTGLTSAFLNDARKIHLGAMSRGDAEGLLREYVKDAFRVAFAWDVTGGFAPALKWVGPKLAAEDADPAAVEAGLKVWVRPLFQQWWEDMGAEEHAVLKEALGEGVIVAELGDKERWVAEGLARSGFLMEVEGGRMVLGGRVWREFVRDV